MAASKNFYSYAQDQKAVALIDIVGFGKLTQATNTSLVSAEGVFLFLENCVLPYREQMKTPGKREVPADLSANGHRYGFWYNHVLEGSVNFIYLSDSVLLYSCSLVNLFNVVSNIFGSAIVWAVPIRAAITMGDLHHSEWIERPGSGICLYGGALTKAVEQEKQMSGKALRVSISDEVYELVKGNPRLMSMVAAPGVLSTSAELKWWLNALAPHNGKSESEQLRIHFDRWFKDKNTAHWFGGPNKADAVAMVDVAEKELKSFNR